MKMKHASRKSVIKEWRDSIIFAVVVATFFRWGIAEAFVIPTPSMENSMLVGDYLFVSKYHYGSRTPRTPLQVPLTHQKIWGTEIPSYLPWIQLPSYRLPGLRKVKRNEPVVFNVPKDLLDPTERPIDLKTYLVKRCVAIGGDVLMIQDKQVYVNSELLTNPSGLKFSYDVTTKDQLRPNTLEKLGLDSDDYTFLGRLATNHVAYRMLLTTDQYQEITTQNYMISIRESSVEGGFPLFPYSMSDVWTDKNYGPLTIPQKGMSIIVNDSTLAIYGEIIQKYEGHREVNLNGGKLQIDGREVSTYEFQQDYYFMMGDSRDNSLDSRYWGFVPEDHILGKPLFIWMSIDNEAGWFNKIRWKRLFSKVD
jgi:signal peptidase I